MKFQTTELPYPGNAVGFSAGQTNLLVTNDSIPELRVAPELQFRRLYLAWWQSNCGDAFIRVTGKMKFQDREVGNPFIWEWQIGSTLPSNANAVRSGYTCPAFNVQKRPIGSGNDYPYDLQLGKDFKMATLPIQDTATSLWYMMQVVMSPYCFAERFDTFKLRLDVISGASMPSIGLCGIMCSIDSSAFPF